MEYDYTKRRGYGILVDDVGGKERRRNEACVAVDYTCTHNTIRRKGRCRRKSPAAVYRGVYDSSKNYYGNQYRLDVVKQGGTYYIARIDAGTFSNVAPPNTSKWNEFGAQFESIATGLLLAENANIAGWIFRNNRLESQNGTFYLDGTTGDVNIKGNFVGKISTALNGNRIVINSADNTIIMYTNKNGQDYEILRIEGEDIGFGLLRPKLTMRELSTSDNSVMATLNISAYEIGFYRYDRTDLPFSPYKVDIQVNE